MHPLAKRHRRRARGSTGRGFGRSPFLRQATFTVWDSVAAMDAYARTGPHLEAIKAAAQNQYFSESMFARFVPISIEGRWKDRDYG